jgi:Tfp pilus assembly protein PilF
MNAHRSLILTNGLGLFLVVALLSGPALGQAPQATIKVLYPQAGTVLPQELPSPALRWTDGNAAAVSWRISAPGLDALVANAKVWRPETKWWKGLGVNPQVQLTIEGLDASGAVVSTGSLDLAFAALPPGELLFFQEQTTAFEATGEDALGVNWRIGPLAAEDSGKVLIRGLPGCVVCHSFSADGALMSLGVGPGAGGVVVAPVAQQMNLENSQLKSWEGPKVDDGEALDNFGTFSVLSPDGRYLLGTVQDRLLLVPSAEQSPWGAVFLPVRGQLAYRDLQSGQMAVLPGASEPSLVQANPSWSPDGKALVFVRAPRIGLGSGAGLFLSVEEAKLFSGAATKAAFDIYRLPFNGGQGGEAVPLKGASANGARNFYPRWSPDGKWVVFSKAALGKNGPADPELYIVPAEGGEARRMNCNVAGMNTWHSFSADGRWLVFSAGPAGQPFKLYLTRIEESGEDHPAVLLENFSKSGFSAGLPEFLHGAPQAPQKLDVSALVSTGNAISGLLLQQGDYAAALAAAEKRLETEPGDADAHMKAALAMIGLGKGKEADEHWKAAPEDLILALNHANFLLDSDRLDEAYGVFEQVRAADPTMAEAYLGAGVVKLRQGVPDASIGYWLKAVELDPKMAKAHLNLGNLLLDRGNLKLADKHLLAAARLEPRNTVTLTNLAMAKFYLGSRDEARRYLKLAMRYDAFDPSLPDVMASMYAETGDYPAAVEWEQRALRLATLRKMEKFASLVEERIKSFQQGKPWQPKEAQVPEAPPAGGDDRQVEQK